MCLKMKVANETSLGGRVQVADPFQRTAEAPFPGWYVHEGTGAKAP